ncbi:MAG TPA: glycosyltransferase family 39 protein, partial [Thermomicrobiales bacterium]|nr:glycosyltransferase family 39 protein [Thermomicrobiales bacterium]
MSVDHLADQPADPSSDRPSSEPVLYNEILILLGILMVAGWLRFTGIEWGKNLYLHPDERFQTMVVVAAKWPSSLSEYFDSQASPLNPYNNGFGSYIYGTFPLFASKLIGTITGNVVYGDAHLPGRAFSAVCDLVTVLLVYLTGRRLFGRRTALLAAALCTVTVLQIQSAHYFTSDSAVVVMCLAAFYLALRAESSGAWGWNVACGIAVGLAIASKINALPIALVMALPVFERWRRHGVRSIWRAGSDKPLAPVAGLVLAVLAALWTFRIAQPYAFAGPSPFSFRLDPRWVKDVRYWRDVQNGVGDSPPSMQWADRTPILFSSRNLVLWGMGPLLGLTAIAALVAGGFKLVAARRMPEGWQVILVGWPAFHLLYYGSGFVQTMRYLLPAYPFLTLLAAAFLIRVLDLGTARGWGSVRIGRRISLPWAALPAVIVLAGTFLYAVGFVGIYTRTTTREAASRWIYANVPPGSTIASEHWDDGIPVSLPGHDTNLYPGFQLELFFPDSAEKLDTLVGQLDDADYLVVTSNRLYATIPRIPERYPMTSEYYRMLFSGDLGFDLIHTETSYPTYLGIELNDDRAEEAFTVYDHPKVFIFRKNDSYDASAIHSRLDAAFGDGAYAIAPINAGKHLLMMDDETRVQQQTSGTWRTMFNANSLANRYPTIIWYLVLQIMALASVPFCWRLFDSLPDR